MKYMGSKRRIAKEILPIILDGRKDNQYYVEPFCGGCNTLDKVLGNRIGNDINKYLISFLNEMKKEDFSLPFIGEEQYKEMKNNQDKYPEWLLGYAGFQLSFGAKWFGGYRRDKKVFVITRMKHNRISKHNSPCYKMLIFILETIGNSLFLKTL